jgi:hypothetical protein
MKEVKDMIAYQYLKLKTTRNILFRAFLINYVTIFLGWLFSMTHLYDFLITKFTHFSTEEAYAYMMNIFGIWQTLGVVFLLFPALAIWWEMSANKKLLLGK